MKQIYSTLFFTLISTISFSQTFDWETATNNGNNITQTVSSITATVTSDKSLNLLDVGGFDGSSGKIVFNNVDPSESLTVTFDNSVNIISIYVFTSEFSNDNWVFTPSGGNNSSVNQAVPGTGGVTASLNWNAVTSFTITSQVEGTSARFAIDDIILSSTTLGIADFNISNSNLKLYPNPSSDFIKITGLTTIKHYEIYNTLGQEIKKGIVSENKKIDIQNLTNGIYFLKFKRGDTLKFIKK